MKGKELRAALEELGLQQWYFAQMFGLTEGAESRWVQGSRAVPSWVPPVIDLLRERRRWRESHQ